jgi:hypothetical protein
VVDKWKKKNTENLKVWRKGLVNQYYWGGKTIIPNY